MAVKRSCARSCVWFLKFMTLDIIVPSLLHIGCGVRDRILRGELFQIAYQLHSSSDVVWHSYAKVRRFTLIAEAKKCTVWARTSRENGLYYLLPDPLGTLLVPLTPSVIGSAVAEYDADSLVARIARLELEESRLFGCVSRDPSFLPSVQWLAARCHLAQEYQTGEDLTAWRYHRA